MKTLVVGLGNSGFAAAELLLRRGCEVRVYDRSRAVEVPEGAVAFLGEAEPPAVAFQDVELVVLSPGVPPARPRELQQRYAPQADVTGELELGLRCFDTPAPRVLVTGTNGKSTVTALTGELLRAGGRRPFVGGNLGTPLCALLVDVFDGRATPPDALVIECSSFQLETLSPGIRREVGMVLNITPDHLDRYGSFTEYADTKAKVFAGLGAGGLALVGDDDESRRIAPSRADIRVIHVGARGDARIDDDGIGLGPGHTLVVDDARFDRALLRLPGRHNSSNALFAIAAARHLGVDAESCRRGLVSFTGLPHRMVLVRELDGVRWYNDSKATNVASTLASLGGLAEPFVLIAGGRGKGDDLAPLGELVRSRGRGLVTIGETAEQFHALARGQVPAEIAGELDKAIEIARKMAQPGDAVVLAPACASYDQFKSYAHRGDVFTASVNALR